MKNSNTQIFSQKPIPSNITLYNVPPLKNMNDPRLGFKLKGFQPKFVEKFQLGMKVTLGIFYPRGSLNIGFQCSPNSTFHSISWVSF